MNTRPRGRDSSRNFAASLSRAMRARDLNTRRTGSPLGLGMTLHPSLSHQGSCLGANVSFWGEYSYTETGARKLFDDLLAFLVEEGYPHKVIDEPYEHDVVEWSWRVHVESKHDASNRCQELTFPNSEEAPHVQ